MKKKVLKFKGIYLSNNQVKRLLQSTRDAKYHTDVAYLKFYAKDMLTLSIMIKIIN